MVPQKSPPPGPRRQLSPETTQELRDVISERWRALEQSEERLRSAVRAASDEARERGLRPEELIRILKEIEADVFEQHGPVRASDQDLRVRIREFLVTSCINAYFDER